jgi:hypothetical protein
MWPVIYGKDGPHWEYMPFDVWNKLLWRSMGNFHAGTQGKMLKVSCLVQSIV